MKRDITIEDMREIMSDALRKQGHPDEYIAGYIAAMDTAGYTAPRKPPWIRNSAALTYLLPPPTKKPPPPQP